MTTSIETYPTTTEHGVGIENPSLGIGLAEINDWSTQMPFINVFKQFREMEAKGKWANGGREKLSHEEMIESGHFDENGWPKGIPEGMDHVFATFAWTNKDALDYRSGTYVVEWEGTGSVDIWGATVVSRTDNTLTVEIDDNRNFELRIKQSDPDGTGDYVRDIAMVKEEHLELHRAGAIFNPDWIDLIEDVRSVRFMDWMETNNSEQSEWADRPKMTDAQWSLEGAPLEVMVELANQIGTDPWFTLPYGATEEYVREFAKYVHENLDPNLKAHVEFSNEVWNFIFKQAHASHEEGQEALGSNVGSAWLQNYGVKAAEVADIFTEVFGDDADARLVNVLATHTASTGRADPILNAPDYADLDPDFVPPHASFDAWAVTGYFNGLTDLTAHGEKKITQVREWIAESIARSTGPEDRYDYFIEIAIQEMRDGSVTGDPRGGIQHNRKQFEKQAAIAEAHGLDLVMYEGGSHVVGLGNHKNDRELTEFLQALNASDEMGEIYAEVLQMWHDVGGQSFNAFVDVQAHTKFGSWGALEHLGDSSARWDVLMNDNEVRQGDWEIRADGAFDQGVIRYGDDAANALAGTGEEDFLIGRGGDDVLNGGAGNDGLNGGAGNDILIAGSGNDTLVGGDGADTFITGIGYDTIEDFEIGIDTLDLSAAGIQLLEFNVGLLDIRQDGADTVIVHDTGAVTVKNTSIAALTADDIQFTEIPSSASADAAFGFTVNIVNDTLTTTASEGIYIGAINKWSETAHDLGVGGRDLARGEAVDTYYVTLRRGGADESEIHNGGVDEARAAGAEFAVGVNTIIATDASDMFRGRSDAVVLDMKGGNDFIKGSRSDDVIIGGAGNDQIAGGTGSDTFVFRAGDGHDTIEDFEIGIDRIDLTSFGFSDEALDSSMLTFEAREEGLSLQIDGEGSILFEHISLTQLQSDAFIF